MRKNNTITKSPAHQLDANFEPSMKSLIRIMKYMSENHSGNKTNLSLETNLNYSRLSEHITWLEQKSLVESTVEESKINVSLTESGRKFASTLSKL